MSQPKEVVWENGELLVSQDGKNVFVSLKGTDVGLMVCVATNSFPGIDVMTWGGMRIIGKGIPTIQITL